MKHVLSLLLAMLVWDAHGQSIQKPLRFDPTAEEYLLQPNVLVVLKEPFNLKERLDAVISQVASNSASHEGSGAIPRSVCEAAELIEHSTHMQKPIKHGIEYGGYYIFSDVTPRDFKEWMIAGDPRKPNTSRVFTKGYVVKKGEKMIYSFKLPEGKPK